MSENEPIYISPYLRRRPEILEAAKEFLRVDFPAFILVDRGYYPRASFVFPPNASATPEKRMSSKSVDLLLMRYVVPQSEWVSFNAKALRRVQELAAEQEKVRKAAEEEALLEEQQRVAVHEEVKKLLSGAKFRPAEYAPALLDGTRSTTVYRGRVHEEICVYALDRAVKQRYCLGHYPSGLSIPCRFSSFSEAKVAALRLVALRKSLGLIDIIDPGEHKDYIIACMLALKQKGAFTPWPPRIRR